MCVAEGSYTLCLSVQKTKVKQLIQLSQTDLSIVLKNTEHILDHQVHESTRCIKVPGTLWLSCMPSVCGGECRTVTPLKTRLNVKKRFEGRVRECGDWIPDVVQSIGIEAAAGVMPAICWGCFATCIHGYYIVHHPRRHHVNKKDVVVLCYHCDAS